MKSFRNFMLSVIIIISGLIYINFTFGLNITQNVGSLFQGTEYVEELKEVTSMEPIIELVPVEYKETVTEIVEQITSDPKTQQVINQQINTILNDVSNGTMTFDDALVQAELNGLIDSYAPEIEKATNQTVSKEVIKTKMQEVITGYDMKTIYEKVVTEVEKKLTPSQLKMINLAHDIQDAGASWKIGSAVLFTVSLLTLIVFNLKFDWTRTLIPASIAMLVGVLISKFIAQFVINTLLNRAGLNPSQINVDYSFYSTMMLISTASILLSLGATYLAHKYEERMYL